MNKSDAIVESVVGKFSGRSQVGIRKYGTTLEENNVDNYLNHLQMELMDAVNYTEKLLQREEDVTQMVKLYTNDSELGEAIRKKYG